MDAQPTAQIARTYTDTQGREITRLAMVQHVDGGPAMTVYAFEGDAGIMCIWPAWFGSRICSEQLELHHAAWFDPKRLQLLLR